MLAMKFMPALTIAALVIAVVAGLVIWQVVGDAPQEDADTGPQRTAVEVLEAARIQDSTLAGCDDLTDRTTLPPTWDDERRVWVLRCARGELTIGGFCYEVDDETLELTSVDPLSDAYLEYCLAPRTGE